MTKNNSAKYISNISPFSSPATSNAPTEYNDRQTQYMKYRTKKYMSERSYLATDYVSARVQGLTDDFYEWTECKVRLSDATTQNVTGLTTKKNDDFKLMMIPDLDVDYIPIGAKVETMGSVWIVINPYNISDVTAKTVIARCNASYNSYDKYGNIVTEPLIIDNTAMLSNREQSPLNLVLMSGYFNVVCQLNDITRQLGENKRLILGSKAYHITGFTDFIQEFTGNYESNHYLTFTVREEEPTKNDDIPNRIADGNNSVYSAEITGRADMKVGTEQGLNVYFTKNGIPEATRVNWIWETSDEEVAKVSKGTVLAKSEGEATITATMQENKDIVAYFNLNVTSSAGEPYIQFVGNPDEIIPQYSTSRYEAKYFINGQEETNNIEWTFENAPKNSYSVTVSGNACYVDCIKASNKPLIITASKNEASESIFVFLEGY